MKMRVITLSLLLIVGNFNGLYCSDDLTAAVAAITLVQLPPYAQTMKNTLEKLEIRSELTVDELKKARQEKAKLLLGFYEAFTKAQQDASGLEQKKQEKFIKKALDDYMNPRDLGMGGIAQHFRKNYGPEDPYDKKMRLEREAREAEDARIRLASQATFAPVTLEDHPKLKEVREYYESKTQNMNSTDRNSLMNYFSQRVGMLKNLEEKFGVAIIEDDIKKAIENLSNYIERYIY